VEHANIVDFHFCENITVLNWFICLQDVASLVLSKRSLTYLALLAAHEPSTALEHEKELKKKKPNPRLPYEITVWVAAQVFNVSTPFSFLVTYFMRTQQGNL
jgi:hypothetical protein